MADYSLVYNESGGMAGINNEVIISNMLPEITVKINGKVLSNPDGSLKEEVWKIIEEHKLLELIHVCPIQDVKDAIEYRLKITVGETIKQFDPWWDYCERPQGLKLIEQAMKKIIQGAS